MSFGGAFVIALFVHPGPHPVPNPEKVVSVLILLAEGEVKSVALLR